MPSGSNFRPSARTAFRGLQRSPFGRFAQRDASSLFAQLGMPRYEPQLPPLEDEERRRRESESIAAFIP